MNETEEKTTITMARELYDAGFSEFGRDLGFFPLSVFFQNVSNRVFSRIDISPVGKTGIWYELERSDSVYSEDADGNFY